MRFALSTPRQMHMVLAANVLLRDGHEVALYTSTPEKKLRGIEAGYEYHFEPKWTELYTYMTQKLVPLWLDVVDTKHYDRAVAGRIRRMKSLDVFYGWAGVSVASGRAAKERGAKFVLDRACPHGDVQEAVAIEEAAKTGAKVRPQMAEVRERYLEEYERADVIVVPSRYSGSTFPERQRGKIVYAPLLGRMTAPVEMPVRDWGAGREFTVGVVGGDMLRKGYLYLLRAWKKLGLKNARLLLRNGAGFAGYPVLEELARSMPNVEQLAYVPDINDFYRRCDVFVLPSVDDGFGMVLFEAMAHGVPVIATTHCGASELIETEKQGLIVAPGNEDALAGAILRMYESKELRQRLGEAGRELAMELQRAGAEGMYASAIREVVRRVSG